VDDETALLQGATPAQIAAVPFENKVERCFAAALAMDWAGFFTRRLTATKVALMSKGWLGVYLRRPRTHRKREVLEAGKFVEECLRKAEFLPIAS